MSLTRNIYDRNAYKANLLRSTDPVKYIVNEDFPATETARPDHLNGFIGKHAAPSLVDHESDLYRLDGILSNDPYMQFPKVNASQSHKSRNDGKGFPSVQYTRLYQGYYPTTELSYNRTDHQSVVMHPIHANNYIGLNSREVGRFTNNYVPTH
jgi:hypothetical protein